jgi:hypothetical protein
MQWTVEILPHFHLCLRHGAGKHFSGFGFFLLPNRIHARPADYLYPEGV